MIIDKRLSLFVNKLLNLPANGSEQDWAVELANRFRLDEFINVLSTMHFSLTIEYAIMSLILASYVDFIFFESDKSNFWKNIKKLLDRHNKEYLELLQYWAVLHEKNEGNWFNITPIVRDYLKNMKRCP